jgi:NAD(P)-dependent dehydrogenase (short-subunit alcohol dehydrogenase family)
MNKLEKKICIVTGGTGLIGQEIVNDFLRNGATVIFTFNKNISKAKKFHKNRKNLFYYKLNIKQKSSIKNLLKFIKIKFKRLDVLVNNAGINNPTDFDKIKEKDWDNILAVNLKGPFMIMQESLDLIKKSKNGSIINVSSVSGQYGGPRTAHYAASKAGLISLNQVAARFFSKYNVRCNSLVPGFIQSEMAQKALKSKKMNNITSSILLNRQGSAKEVAKSASFLASEESSYMTGQVLNVNGGLYF